METIKGFIDLLKIRQAIKSLMDVFTYFPTWFQIVLPVAILILGGLSLNYRYYDHTYRYRWERINVPSAQDRRVTLNTVEYGYSEVIGELHETENTEEGELQPTTKIQVDEVVQHTNGAESQNVRLTNSDGELSDFTYLLLHDEFAWKSNSATFFENNGGESETFIQAALNQDFVRDTVQGAPIVFCVGLASSEPIQSKRLTNTILSDRRAYNLCVALKLLGLVDKAADNETLIGLGLGERIPDKAAKIPRSRERPVVIISLKDARFLPTRQTLIDTIYKISEYRNVGLGRYQRDDFQSYLSMSVHGDNYVTLEELSLSPSTNQDEMMQRAIDDYLSERNED